MTRRRLPVLVLFVLLPLLVQARAETDVFGRPLASLVAQGRPLLVLYTNRETKSAVQDPARALAFRLRDAPFTTVVRVDARGVPGFFHGFVRDKIKDSQEQGVKNFVEMYRRHGLEPPADARDRLIFVLDDDGAAHAKVGLGKGFGEAFAVVLDADGHELARGPFPRDEGVIEGALRRAAVAHPDP